MKIDSEKNGNFIKGLCLGLAVILMGAAIAALPFSGGVEGLIHGWKQILIAPCPLITQLVTGIKRK